MFNLGDFHGYLITYKMSRHKQSSSIWVFALTG